MNVLTVDNVNLWDAYAVMVTVNETYEAAEPDIEFISVKGRNGDLTMDNGRYSNINVSYPAFIYRDMHANVSALSGFLHSLKGYKRICDSSHPDEFRLGQYVGGFAPTVSGNDEVANFTMNFNCKPQRFLKAGEATYNFSSSGTLNNPTRFESKPLLTVVGSGTVVVGGVTITISTTQAQIVIDCETGDCYNGSTNCNADVTFSSTELPTLSAGENSIGLSGVTSLAIVPRWYTI